jgi:predicted dehydrogenase
MDSVIRWGILGCGRIARKFASDLRHVDNARLEAVGSRNQESADEFLREFPAKFSHGSYEGLVSNPDVDVIYVASQHGLHLDHVMLCLEHKKSVPAKSHHQFKTSGCRLNQPGKKYS